MRRDTQSTHFGNELGSVVGLVTAQRYASASGQFLDHWDRCLGFGGAGSVVISVATTRPLRFSITTCPMWHTLAADPGDFL